MRTLDTAQLGRHHRGSRVARGVEKRMEQEYSGAALRGIVAPAAGATRTADDLNSSTGPCSGPCSGCWGASRGRCVPATCRQGRASPRERLVEACARGGRTYIAGKGGPRYMDVEEFEQAGIQVVWQEFYLADAFIQRAGGRRSAACP